MYEILAISTLVLSSYLLVRLIGADGTIEFIFIFFCVATAQIALTGYLLSSVNHLAEVRGWALLGITTLFAVAAMVKLRKRPSMLPGFNLRVLGDRVLSVKRWYLEETSGFEKLLLTPMMLVTVSLGIINLAIIIKVAPSNHDSMTYHLARVAYYLQHGNLDYYPANIWDQVLHAKNSPIFMLYSYLVSGRNENMTQLVQFIAYWVYVFSIYGITRKTGNSRSQGIFAALVSSLLVISLLQASTTQNDMIIAAYFGSIIYFLFAFRDKREKKYLALAALGIGLAVGASAKAFLYLPLSMFVGGYVLLPEDVRKQRLRNLAYFAASILIAVVLFALPAGYVENYRNFGHPLGTDELVEFSFEGKSIEYIARNGTKNLLRYGFDILSIDGLPPLDIVNKTHSLLIALPKAVVSGLGIDLESGDVRKSFAFQKHPFFFSHEGWSSWGIFGFALIWIVVFLSAIGIIKSGDNRILSFAAILVIFAMAYEGYYEPHRGRFLITCAVFAVPTIGIILNNRNKLVRAYVLLVVLLGCISAVSAIMLRPARPPISMKHLAEKYPQVRRFEFLPESVFDMDRLAQVMTNAWGHYPAFRAFDLLVPKNATVAVYLYEDHYYEYPLFGEHFTRRLIPINPFVGGFKEIPANADYLIYLQGFPSATSHDLDLGAGLYLKRLSGARDESIEFFKKVVILKPDHALYRNFLGVEYAKRGLFNKAIEEFRTAVRLSPDEPSYSRNLDKAEGMNNPDTAPQKR